MKFYTRHYTMIKIDEELRKHDSNLDGKIFVVTGCSNGIGCCLADQLLQRGARVIGLDIDDRGAKQLTSKFPDQFEFVSCDLSSADSIANAVKQIRTMINDGFDALFNIAGVGYNHNLSFTSDGTALPTFINAIAPYLLSTSLVDCLEKRRGNIIYTSSSSANHIRSLQASNIKFNRPVQGIISLVKSYGAYAQSKELVNLIAEEQGQRLSVRNVKIYANDPGIVNTQLADSFSNVLFNPFGFEKSDFPICKWYSDLTRSAGAKTPEQAAQSFILLGTTDKYQHLSGGKVVDYEKFVPRSRIKSENERAEIYAEMQSTYRLE